MSCSEKRRTTAPLAGKISPRPSLASVLIADNRFAEAQQILNLFKDQQYFDFDSNKPTAPLTLTERETAVAAELDRSLATIVAAIRQVDELKRAISANFDLVTVGPDEQAAMDLLRSVTERESH